MLTGEIERGLTTDSERSRFGKVKSDGRWGPAKESVARTALKNLLTTNSQALNVYIDQCYSKKAAVARAYFQVKSYFHYLHSISLAVSLQECVASLSVYF